MPDVHVVILAAGKGTRMKSAWPKVLHKVAGAPMIEHVLDAAGQLAPRSISVVVGHQAEVLTAALARHPSLKTVVQKPQLGTAHALQTTEAALAGATGTLVLLSGDVPSLTAASLKTLVNHHASRGAAATVLTAIVPDSKGYGRIVREPASGTGNASGLGRIARIVEEKDASPGEREIKEINSGIYAFELHGLFDALRTISSDNAQREYYLPDLVAIFRAKGLGVETVTVTKPEEIQGINSRSELAAVTRGVRQAKNAELMAAGVTIEDPATTYIDKDVQIGADTVVHPGVSIERGTTIGAGCEIHSGARIIDSSLGDRVVVLNHCVISGARLESETTVGPFAHIRPESVIAAKARVGNFVEIKKSRLGAGSKSMHLAYLGDAEIGKNVNIGAGTITCNYDGVSKQKTTIEDGAFIGSDSQLIAPVTIGKSAYVGTGTTIREDVPSGALAVSAGKQRNLEGWVEKKKQRKP